MLSRLALGGAAHDHPSTGRWWSNASPRGLRESNVVRSVREIGDWQGKAIHISEKFPDGEDAAVIVQAPDEHIIGASRPAGG
jgi:hypothetical protein